MAQTFYKDPDATKSYQINWATKLALDTISTSTWTVPAGITKVSDSNTTTTTTINLSGGTDGTTYTLVNRIVTAGAMTEDDTITIIVGTSSTGLTRASVAYQIYNQLKTLWDAVPLTHTNDTKGPEGDMTLPIDRALRAMRYATTAIADATATIVLTEKLLDLVEWYALERLIMALAWYVDIGTAGEYKASASQMRDAAEKMYAIKTKQVQAKYNIGVEGASADLESFKVVMDDGFAEEADAGEYDTTVYIIRAL